jgi:hypothetical protein
MEQHCSKLLSTTTIIFNKNEKIVIIQQLHNFNTCAVSEIYRFKDNYNRWTPDTPEKSYCRECEWMGFLLMLT